MGWLSDLTGKSASDAANRAAADTYAKQQAAVQGLTSYADTVPSRFNDIASGFDPYAQAGQSALTRLMAGLGLGGAGGSQEFTNAYQSLPGYTEGRDQGLQGAERALNAGNIGQSGRALKSLYRFGSDYENQRSGDYLNRLSGVAGAGQAATGAQAGIQGQGLTTQAGLRQSAFGGDLNSAGTVGQGLVAGAQAKQNALSNLMSSGAYLGGAFLGGGAGGSAFGKLFGGGGGPNMRPSPNGPGTYYPIYG
jgi:hypothetical protein